LTRVYRPCNTSRCQSCDVGYNDYESYNEESMGSRAILQSTAVLTMMSGSAYASVTFDFETIPQGTPTPFSITSDGITATFSSPDGSVFLVLDSTGLTTTLAGNVAVDPGFTRYPLDIVFSEPMASVTMKFAPVLGTPLRSTLLLSAFAGGTAGILVGTASAVGGPAPPTFFPEGVISFEGSSFDAVRLTADVESFAIDDVRVFSAAEVPELTSFTLSVTGIGASLALGRRGHRKRPVTGRAFPSWRTAPGA
jgi:hypothetical protein